MLVVVVVVSRGYGGWTTPKVRVPAAERQAGDARGRRWPSRVFVGLGGEFGRGWLGRRGSDGSV